MLLSRAMPNSYTFPFLLKSCAKAGLVHEGKQIHSHVLKLGLESDAFVHTSLINIGQMNEAKQLFEDIPVRDVVSWNAMIAGYSECGQFEEAIETFRGMQKANVMPNESTVVTVLSACAQSSSVELGKWIHRWIEGHRMGSNLRLVNALVDMYSKCGDVETARRLFEGMSQKDVISWNVMIGGLTHMNRYKEALVLFREMLKSNVEPNDVTYLNVLPSCACLCALDLGKWIHTYINKNFDSSTSTALFTSLIDMYAKCGNVKAAEQVFNGMDNKSLSSWNAMISGLAIHGEVEKALGLLSRMVNEGFKPDDITFVGVLSACNHAGSLELGQSYFSSMIQDYKITPKLQHYGCVVDLLGRNGLFDEVEALIESMNVKPDGAIWGSLLEACRAHGQVELGEIFAQRLFELEPDNPGAYVLLSNIYAKAGRWDDVARIRTKLNDEGMKKVPGSTSIEVDSVVHEFLVGDKTHPQSKDIYMMLDEIDRLLEMAGFVPDTTEVLYDMDEEWKECAISHHSEKLAIAFGLISTKPRTTIRIAKNLRVCRNCHSATKLISKIFNREIIARDRNRFHHFRDGNCSCKDCW
ncbi:DYW_deaminase domain-containing protein [Psidium guajava]|nr:DYW_deaminase domain-containing protein [Psidium guajava]